MVLNLLQSGNKALLHKIQRLDRLQLSLKDKNPFHSVSFPSFISTLPKIRAFSFQVHHIPLSSYFIVHQGIQHLPPTLTSLRVRCMHVESLFYAEPSPPQLLPSSGGVSRHNKAQIGSTASTSVLPTPTMYEMNQRFPELVILKIGDSELDRSTICLSSILNFRLLPKKLEHLVWTTHNEGQYDEETNCLPENLRYLDLGSYFTSKEFSLTGFANLPKSLTALYYNYRSLPLDELQDIDEVLPASITSTFHQADAFWTQTGSDHISSIYLSIDDGDSFLDHDHLDSIKWPSRLTSLHCYANVHFTSFNVAQFPRHLTKLGLRNLNIVDASFLSSWPPSLTNVDVEVFDLKNCRFLPRTLRALNISGDSSCLYSDPTVLQQLPSWLAALPPSLTWLQLMIELPIFGSCLCLPSLQSLTVKHPSYFKLKDIAFDAPPTLTLLNVTTQNSHSPPTYINSRANLNEDKNDLKERNEAIAPILPPSSLSSPSSPSMTLLEGFNWPSRLVSLSCRRHLHIFGRHIQYLPRTLKSLEVQGSPFRVTPEQIAQLPPSLTRFSSYYKVCHPSSSDEHDDDAPIDQSYEAPTIPPKFAALLPRTLTSLTMWHANILGSDIKHLPRHLKLAQLAHGFNIRPKHLAHLPPSLLELMLTIHTHSEFDENTDIYALVPPRIRHWHGASRLTRDFSELFPQASCSSSDEPRLKIPFAR